jgi:hypothetical protein
MLPQAGSINVWSLARSGVTESLGKAPPRGCLPSRQQSRELFPPAFPSGFALQSSNSEFSTFSQPIIPYDAIATHPQTHSFIQRAMRLRHITKVFKIRSEVNLTTLGQREHTHTAAESLP